MTKEKIIEIVNSCVQYNANQGTWSIDNRFAYELLALIEQEKDDLLKEFVEWYKQMLIKDHDDKAWMMNHTEEQEVEDRYYYRGQCNAIQRLITLLDSDLKKFLEDRNEL